MKAFFALFILFALVAHAQPRGRGPEHPEPRAKGIPQHGSFHRVVPQGAQPMRMQVYSDRRSHVEVMRDPHVVVFNHVGWKPAHRWDHWYRDWGTFWRFTDWSDVRTVTCEAVDTQTEQLFPVTETRAGNWVWTSDLVNNVASRSLDECAAVTGHPESCTLVERECWNSLY